MNDQEIDVLKAVSEAHRLEIRHHREIQFRCFTWSNGLFLAAFGAVVAARRAEIEIGLLGMVLLTVAFLSFTLTAWALILRSRRALETNARIVADVALRLGLFDSTRFEGEEAVYPLKWKGWGVTQRASIETWFYLTNIAVLCGATLAACWAL